MDHERLWAVALLSLTGVLPGCGGAEPPPPQTPSPRVAAEPPARPKPASAAKPEPAARADAPRAAQPKSTEPPPVEPKPAEPAAKLGSKPHDIITGESTSYSFNFASSDAKTAAESKCRDKVGEEARAMADCLAKAREKFGITVLRFVKKNKRWWWITYERRGSNLITLHKIPFEFGTETEDTIALRPTGKDEGLAPLARLPREVVVRLPNEYSIELVDPTHGKMVYDAKIGMVQ